jgi:hypothetical protein
MLLELSMRMASEPSARAGHFLVGLLFKFRIEEFVSATRPIG